MCTLLTVVKGARSFEELRSVDGTEYATFKEACLARCKGNLTYALEHLCWSVQVREYCPTPHTPIGLNGGL